MRKQGNRSDAKPRQVTPDDVLRSARELDNSLHAMARAFRGYIWDLPYLHPDIKRDLCGCGGAEALSQIAIEVFDRLRFDAKEEVTSFETLTRDALKRHELRR